MCSQIDHFLQAFAKIRVDKNKKSWTELTKHCSPYKPFLLLSILDHIETGRITKNFIELSFELIQTFRSYINLLPDLGRKADMSYPFYYLSSSDFWKLLPRDQSTGDRKLGAPSIKKLQELYFGARFNPDLFPLMQMQSSRDKLRTTLIGTYFTEQLHSAIAEQSNINCGSDIYSDVLLEVSERLATYKVQNSKPVSKGKIRDQGFRKAIVKLYDHRCALCGIKMRTPEGHTAVDAAHIKPWSESQNDHPTNGMALCKLCHWSFDEGFMSVDKKYNVLISPMVMKSSNLPGHIMTLSDRPMFRPAESKFWPDLDNFQWHHRKRFRRG